MAATIYHVATEWDGGDLEALARRHDWSDVTAGMIADRWPDCDPWYYYSTDGCYVHCHDTLAEAVAYRDEMCPGGEILAIDDDDIEVVEGTEYPHPTVRGSIPRWSIRVVEPITMSGV